MRSRRIHALVACGALMAALWLGVPSSVSMAAAQDDLILTRGTVITVTSLSDELNGDASTVAGLMARPGPDGLSLREAIEATNQDPGLYTVEFAADLAGLTISAAPLPQLLSGGVIINGDIDGDSKPDITIQAASTADYNPGLTVSSGDNTLHALELIGWGQGVSLSPPETETNATYANTTLANLIIRDVHTGILLNSPGGGELRDTQNRWLDTRIVGNRIEATYSGIELQLSFTIGDAVDGLVIEHNEIHVEFAAGTEPGGGIGLSAGFWDGSTGNQFTNVVITGNTITGGVGVTLATGYVGASGNLMSNVRISDNDLDGPILVLASDASTAWIDPTYTPVGYPEDNVIRDIDIVDNTIKWRGYEGIQIMAGNPGSHNTVTNVRIAGNDLHGTIGCCAAIRVGAAGGEDDQWASGNSVTGLRIEDNKILLAAVTLKVEASGAILLEVAEGRAVDNQLSDVRVTGNVIESPIPGIHLLGGGEDTTANQLNGVELTCNRIIGVPGILMTGGQGAGAVGNVIEDVVLSGNLTGEVMNDVTSHADTQGATGNEVAWTVVDQIPADCSISAPSPPASEAGSEPTPGAVTQDSANQATETGPDSPEPWVWVVGAASVVGLVISWVLLARRRKSLRRTT